MTSPVSELRLPADPAYIVVAKRAAAGFASVAGFDVEAVHDLVIAVAQACENAISCTHQVIGEPSGQLRLTFALEDQHMVVNVQSSCGRARVKQAATKPAAAIARRRKTQVVAEPDATELALRLMGLFVDEYRYRIDERAGGLRVRLTKYRVS